MTRARIHGYARNITDVEQAKVLAARNLIHGNQMIDRYFGTSAILPDGRSGGRLEPIRDLEIDESQITYQTYRHGGLHMQATYEFDYPEAS